VTSGLHRVEFRDFFIADELNSMMYVFILMEFTVCAYVHGWNELDNVCDYQRSWVTPAVGMLPALWRLLQCIRRYVDNRLMFPHLANGLKYLLTIVTIWLAAVSRISHSTAAFALWVLSSFVTSIYAGVWDIYMDWGLLEKGSPNPLLRAQLIYPPWMYYFAMVTNSLLRVSWIINVSPNQYGLFLDFRVVAFFSAVLELVRRFQWNVFRMENEHVNNCGMFRATKAIPLPFGVDTKDKELVHGYVQQDHVL
jgi:hypothetical protein